MHHQGTNSGSGSGASSQGTTPPSIAPAPAPPQSPQGQQQVQATQVQMQQQQQNASGGGGGNAGGGGGTAGVQQQQQQQQNVGNAPNNNMTSMSAAAIQQSQMQQQQQMAPPQAPTQQTLTHPHSAMHQVSEWGHGRVQVIQQPLQNPTYLQQIYNTQGQLLMPGNIALHPAGMNPSIQSLGSLGFQFQTKAGGGGGGNAGGGGTAAATMVPVSCGTATLTVAGKLSGGGGGCSPMHHNHLHHQHPTLLPAQVIAAGKPFQPNQLAQHMITTQGKSVLQAGQAASFPGYTTIPTTSNQTLVISQLGVISSQPNILPAHAHGQGGKPGEMQKIMGGGGKSNVVSSNGMGGGGVGGGGGGVKGGNNQQQQQCVVSQPQLITTQAPTAAMLGSQAQLISPIQFPWQAFGTSLPQGIAWATPGGLQSPAALLTTQNPIFIRGAQQHDPSGQGGQGHTATQGGVFIQSPPPQAMATHNATISGTPTGMQTGNNTGGTAAGNQGNGNAQQHQAQQAQPQITHQIHHQHQLAMKVASVGTGSGRVGSMDGGGGGSTGGTTIQANIQPKTSVASNVLPPRSMSGMLPGSPGVPNIRPASSVSTQTGSSGGPGGMGMGSLQLPKNLGKVRIKPTMNRASPAPSMKADAANQTKPQPISPANMQHQTQHQQQLAAVAAQVSVANRMILTSASSNGAPLLPDKGQQITLQAVKTFTSSSASTTSTTTSTSTSCSPVPTLPILPPLTHPTATAVLLPHPSLQAQLLGQAGCPPSPSGNANGPNVSVSSPMRPVGAPTPSGIVASMPVSISLAPPSSPSHHLHPSQGATMQHQMMGPPMVAMVAAAPSPNQGMQNVPGSSPPVSVVTSSTGMGPAGPGAVLSVVTGSPSGIVNNQVNAKEEGGDVGMSNVGDGSGSMMVVSEDRRNGEASPASGVTPMEGVVETGIAASQNSEVNGDKEKIANGVAELSTGNTDGTNSGEDGSGTKSDTISTGVGSSGATNGPTTAGTVTGMVVGTSRDSHKLPPPKALVKPQVLTHVIEGFVIQEASEPFAVNRSSLLSEMPQPSLKSNNQMIQNHATQQQQGAQDKENVQHHHMSNHMVVAPSSNESEEPPKKKLAQEVQVGVPQTAKLPADLAKCEFCGKVDLRSKFKKSKRFCTLACAKSKRLGLYKPEDTGGKKGTNAVDINAVSGIVSAANAKDQGKADWQKSKGQEWNGNQVAAGQDGGRLSAVGVTPQEESNHTTDNETNDSSGAESSSLSPSEIVQGQDSTSARTSGVATGDPLDDNNSTESGPLSGGQVNATPSTPPQPRINPIKWTVSDVCEFIRNLPGCSDYAEDFAIQEIDGQALLLLKEDHLMTAMSMKLGPALKICARIDTMRGDMKEK